MGRTFRKCYLRVTDWEEAGNSADAKNPRRQPDFQLTTQIRTTRRARDNQFPGQVRTPALTLLAPPRPGFRTATPSSPPRSTGPVKARSEERGQLSTVLKYARTHLQVSLTTPTLGASRRPAGWLSDRGRAGRTGAPFRLRRREGALRAGSRPIHAYLRSARTHHACERFDARDDARAPRIQFPFRVDHEVNVMIDAKKRGYRHGQLVRLEAEKKAPRATGPGRFVRAVNIGGRARRTSAACRRAGPPDAPPTGRRRPRCSPRAGCGRGPPAPGSASGWRCRRSRRPG